MLIVHVEKGARSAGRKVDKYKKEILLAAAAVYTGGATLAATGSYAAAGAASGFVTGAYIGYQQDGFGGALVGGVIGGITGGLVGNGMEYYGEEWTAGRVIEESMVSGMSTELQGGDFRSGFDISGVTSLSRYFYNNFVAYDVEWCAGGDAVVKGRFTRPVQHANNIGEVTASINKDQWLTEGGRISRALNQVPGVNAVAGWHDVQKIFLDIDKPGMIRYVVNYPGMLPAAAITYSALLSGVPSTAIALSRLAERNNPLGEHSVWE